MKNKKYLITGSAGFIGFHLSKKLLSKGFIVVGVDNLNNYYDQNLKKDRNKILKKFKNYKFNKIDIKSYNKLESVFKKNKFEGIINLAAQAGVRYSLINPKSYIDNNIIGFFNVIDLTRKYRIKNIIYASTSSIYGSQSKFPIKENFDTNNPTQLYAATKKSNEVIAASYNKLYSINTIGLRFFTVYGPWGRPDMAPIKFAKNILKGKPIKVFNKGLFNFIKLIEKNLKKKAKKEFLPLQKGDVIKTHSSTKLLKKDYGYVSKTGVREGVKKFINWYLSYYG